MDRRDPGPFFLVGLSIVLLLSVMSVSCGNGGGGGNGNGQTPSYGELYVSHDQPGANDGGPGTRTVPFMNLAPAIEHAAVTYSTADIHVAEGTYEVYRGFHVDMVEGVSLYGGWAADWSERDGRTHQTVIQYAGVTGGIWSLPNTPVEAGPGITGATVIDGFVISAGFATKYSAGILVEGGSPTISNNVIDGGRGFVQSSGILTRDAAAPHIIGNTISGGSSSAIAIGVACSGGASPVIEKNIIDGGTGALHAWGLFITHVSTDPTVFNNTIRGGTTGGWSRGINIGFDAEPRIYNNTIDGGTGGNQSSGITIHGSGSGFIVNNIIFTTSAPSRYCIDEAEAVDDPVAVTNNDLFECPDALYYDEGSSAISSISAVNALGDMTVSSNVSASPAFTDLAGGDWHLTALSPVSVTQGGRDLSTDLLDDMEGSTRTVPWSMGAYEYD